ncbi:single-stranded DNA-binding protein [Clostridioides sp. ZZV14-6045]|uniref:single-stranded DNA-binding protein n=1 Tax=Clostridioides sp. ZZV14-6045 TaxID=2811489 RepID=UPI001D0F87F7|nr:single-stranded DNA-binding protein [Clostridioides sp. ZZV14-6045]
MSEKKYNFNFYGFEKVGETLVAYIEGWTCKNKDKENFAEFQTVSTKNGDKLVGNMELNVKIPQSTAKFYFGEDFDKEQHFIRVTAWGQVAERLQKFNPSENMLLGVMGKLKVEESTKKDGTPFKKLVITISNFKSVVKKKNIEESNGSIEGKFNNKNEADFEAIDDDDIPF